MVKLRGLDAGFTRMARSTGGSFVRGRPAGRGRSSKRMGRFTQGNGLMTNSMGMVKRVRREARPIKGSTSMGRSKGRASSLCMMGVFMKVTLKTTCFMGTVILSGLMDDRTKANGRIIKCKERAFISGQTAKSMKGSTISTSSKGMAFSRF